MSEDTHTHVYELGEALSFHFFSVLARICVVGALVIGVYLFAIESAYAATYSFAPASGSYGVGESFSVRLMVDSAGAAVNTGDGTITYDTAKLTAVTVSKDGSPFNLWVTEPTINAGAGTISFAGGGTAAIAGSKAVLTITFKGKVEGDAALKMTKGTLLAGAGQNALSGALPTGTFKITAAASKPTPAPSTTTTPPPVAKKPERVVNIPTPEAPVVKSASHPDQAVWYKERAVKITWDIPYGVTSLKTGFDTTQEGTAADVHEPPTGEFTKAEVVDGVHYFHIRYMNRGGWGSSTTYKISIDGTPPEEFTATATGGDLTAQVRFETRDTLSGIALYRIGVDDARSRDVQPNELVSGGYTITNMDPGDHTITVIAVDQAGNEREAKVPVTVTGTKPVDPSTQPVETSGFGPIYWVSLLFMAALAIVITMLIKERRAFHEEKDHIKREAMEAGDKLINVFGVLRDEIEEKVLELSHKPNMTDNERTILEALKDAIDISEELIDKEIEDVRKLLK
jgi:Cohesin domain